jgi:hypothetical protein
MSTGPVTLAGKWRCYAAGLASGRGGKTLGKTHSAGLPSVLERDAKSPREAFKRVRNSLQARGLVGFRDDSEEPSFMPLFSIAVRSKSRNYRWPQLVRGSTGGSALCLRFQPNLHAT